MKRTELTLLLPPASMATNGDITARIFPLTISGSVYAPFVIVEDIHISPGTGILDIRFTGSGLYNRQHSIGETSSVLPQAAATETSPLTLEMMNLNPDSPVHVVVILRTIEVDNANGPDAYGGAVRFRGTLPLGTDGKNIDYANRNGDQMIFADGPLWTASCVVNGPVGIRNIRDITKQVRILSATGTGKIQSGGSGGKRVIIVKKDGVTMEIEAESLDFGSIFEMDLPSSGNVRILGLIADSIATSLIQNGAITSAKIADGSVTPNKLDRTYMTNVPDGSITPEKLDRAYTLSPIPANAVKTPQIADNSVTPDKLDRMYMATPMPANSVGTLQVANGSITPEKLDRPYPSPADVEAASKTINRVRDDTHSYDVINQIWFAGKFFQVNKNPNFPLVSINLFPTNATTTAGSSVMRVGPGNQFASPGSLASGISVHDTGYRQTTDEGWAYVWRVGFGFVWIPSNRL